jgi:photosystem II stability/assembly factor-like uncharacterized protein
VRWAIARAAPLLILSTIVGLVVFALAPRPVSLKEVRRPAPPPVLLDLAQTRAGWVAAGDRGYLSISADGRLWRPVRSDGGVTLNRVFFRDAEHGWAVGHDATILQTRDAGQHWTRGQQTPHIESPLFDIAFAGDRHGWAVGAYGLFLETQDGGATWSRRTIATSDEHWYAIVPLGGQNLLIVGENGRVLSSADQGENWLPLTSPSAGSWFGALVLPDGGALLFGLRGRLARLAPDLQTLTAIASPTQASLYGGARRGDSIWLTGQNGIVLHSRDAGERFSAYVTADKSTAAAILPIPAAAPNAPLRFMRAGERGLTQGYLP